MMRWWQNDEMLLRELDSMCSVEIAKVCHGLEYRAKASGALVWAGSAVEKALCRRERYLRQHVQQQPSTSPSDTRTMQDPSSQ